MWETPFEGWMLSDPKGLAIYCPEEYLAEELFEIFKQNGVGINWDNGLSNTEWDKYGAKTTYYVTGKRMLYGPRHHGVDTKPYCNYTKCTFHGAVADPLQDVEVGEEEFLAVLNAWGG